MCRECYCSPCVITVLPSPADEYSVSPRLSLFGGASASGTGEAGGGGATPSENAATPDFYDLPLQTVNRHVYPLTSRS
jgi:hypothetical protein